jgi:methyl-accepting chemotaxis protein
MKLSLKNKFMLPTLAFVIITMSVAGTVSYVMSKNALENVINNQITSTATENAKQMSSWLAHPNKSYVLYLNLSSLEFGKSLLNQEEGLIDYSWEGIHMDTAFKKITGTNWTLAVSASEDEILAPVKTIAMVSFIVSGIGILLIGLIIYFITRSVTKPIGRISENIKEGAQQVAMGSDQVSASSQNLASGASEQAASIEETSASIEEMSAMTSQNAKNANQADGLTKEAIAAIAKADSTMQKLTTSMEEISKSGEEISKIIKTIDEIAFQTNLLALNAAVEAARAGEAGAGFAVVADEVINLAMRAADAAKNTSTLIEGTVKKVGEGSDMVMKTNEAFKEVSSGTAKVGDLVSEIAVASNEQSQGIEQINRAVSEMDRIVQQNAATAEESASTSEEMSAQAGVMNQMVNDLIILNKGTSTKKSGNAGEDQGQTHGLNTDSRSKPQYKDSQKSIASRSAKEVTPDQIVHMDDEFKNF